MPGSRARSSGACSVSTLIDGARQVAQLGERPGLDRPAGADDAHPVAQRLDLGEDVAREQHGPPVLARLLDAVLEDRLHERIEPEVGSSSTSNSTSEASAATSATFWRLPFE